MRKGGANWQASKIKIFFKHYDDTKKQIKAKNYIFTLFNNLL